MAKLVAVAAVLLAAATANAEPTFRAGVTFGIDRNIPEAKEYGPLLAVGLSHGRFGVEAHYAYISFMDPAQQIHRLGIGLRGDIWRGYELRTCNSIPHGHPCLQTRALYGELGAARRFGSWRASELATHETTSQRELSATLGYEIGLPGHDSWQVGLRMSVARRDPELMSVCRGAAGMNCYVPDSANQNPGMAASAMLEWAWMFGR